MVLVNLIGKIASKLDLFGRLALLYVVLKIVKTLKAASNPKHILPRTQLALENNVKSHPHEHACFPQFFPSADGNLWLFTKWWLPQAKPWKGVIFLIHGFKEHISRYDHVGYFLAQHGFAVFGMDHQGHGLSEGDPLYVEKFADYLDDYHQYMQHVLALDSTSEFSKKTNMNIPSGTQLKNLPRFVLGHSMGSVITVLTVQKFTDISWTGVILSAGALKVDPEAAPWILRTLAALLSSVLPKIRFPDPGLPHLSDNTLVFQRVLRDPTVYKEGLTPRWANEFFNATEAAMNEAPNFMHDLLMFHGDKDVIALPSGSEEFFSTAASSNKTLKIVPGRQHELLNEEDYEDMLNTIVEWCAKQASSKKLA
ncbi:hypothetical protein THRCLA_06292 [Thraustotheca clavata]|uniref:Serine aminopeptidase S33 domain-containing protein n=1 Tax=Thraustotheca clavata TaxID=74557 RepID=A0A1V9ZQG6_9STRA|nr:hypothetical protein THRCLA_06292 [Thraustotheca clavata]